MEKEYWVPEHVREYLTSLGFHLPIGAMEEHIRMWHEWMEATGSFYNYRDSDGFGRIYEVHRRSIRPAMRVCREWGSLLLNDKTTVVCDDQACTDFLNDFFTSSSFMPMAQATVVRAFGMGTGAWALWVDTGKSTVKIRHYDARMTIPLTWDEEGVTECAFVTRVFYRGNAVDQLQMHLLNSLGTYRIETVCFDGEGNRIDVEGVLPSYETGSTFPTFSIVKPAIDNTRVDMSPYGQSVFADAIDAIQAVDVAFDSLITEVDVSKMRIFLSDVLFDKEGDGKGKRISIPFGKSDCTVFRKVMSTEDMVQEFAPALRTDSQAAAFRIALQMLGDLCGFGINYFDLDSSGYVKTATEVSSDNSQLMRNIARHEHVLDASIAGISHALLHVERGFGKELPDEGEIHTIFDDSIITDTAAEKAQDMAEVGVTLNAWEYRMKWLGEDEKTARARAAEIGADGSVKREKASGRAV
ncbi:MAG: phage portal protein [Eggerthellaceae bacterium]|nr:phage portal protein [Eggerthellaceae bacterium]